MLSLRGRARVPRRGVPPLGTSIQNKLAIKIPGVKTILALRGSEQEDQDATANLVLEKLRTEQILSDRVLNALCQSAAEGDFDRILTEARGVALSSAETKYLRSLASTGKSARMRKP